MTFLFFWIGAGILGSLFMGLAAKRDGEGIDAFDVFFLIWLSVGGFGTLLLSIPFAAIWIRDVLDRIIK